jgi:predicted GNAT superfamily acetyltransferase
MPIRSLSTLEECRAVAAMEKLIWAYAGPDEAIPAAVLVASLKRGGVLLGAFDDAGEMQGYAYAAAALNEGRPAYWSHALGVIPEARERGVAGALKLAQRQQALGVGLDLIEWSYDPLQASSAHLNFAKLGIMVEEYVENMYGDSSSPLHRGTPTDRLIAEWHLSTPHVERRLDAAARAAAPRGGSTGPETVRRSSAPIGVRDSAVIAAVLVNASREADNWLRPGAASLEAEAARVLVEIPTNFTEMLAQQPELARDWRLASRTVFQAYLSRGYRVVDFFVAREQGRGHYLLARAAG